MKISKYFTDTKIKTENRTIEMIGSNETLDRDKEVILMSAWDLKNFKTNPVVLLNHQSWDLPIAKCDKVWKSKGNLMFKIKFPDEGVSQLSDTVFDLYKNGFMSASSVGFMADYKSIVWGDPSKGEPAATYKSVELLELSLCSIGCNPTALATGKSILNDKDYENLSKFETEIPSHVDSKFNEFMKALKNEIDTNEKNKQNYFKGLCDVCGK